LLKGLHFVLWFVLMWPLAVRINQLQFCIHCDHVKFFCMLQSQSDSSPEVPTVRLHVDEEHLPFRENMFDLVLSSLRYSGSAVFCCSCHFIHASLIRAMLDCAACYKFMYVWHCMYVYVDVSWEYCAGLSVVYAVIVHQSHSHASVSSVGLAMMPGLCTVPECYWHGPCSTVWSSWIIFK